MSKTKIHQDYFKSIVFGAEDALVSTTGLVVGVSVAIVDKQIILLTGLVALAVEAVSMAAGQFLSEKAVHQLKKGTRSQHRDNLLLGAFLMFLAYFLGGLVPIIPIFLVSAKNVMFFSSAAGLLGLFLLGWAKGLVTGAAKIKSALEIMVIGGIATALGIAIGLIFRTDL
ncbi:MAG: VIT1/CCC1 transporter family protein [Patescibacteria group bacterium]